MRLAVAATVEGFEEIVSRCPTPYDGVGASAGSRASSS